MAFDILGGFLLFSAGIVSFYHRDSYSFQNVPGVRDPGWLDHLGSLCQEELLPLHVPLPMQVTLPMRMVIKMIVKMVVNDVNV